MIGRRRGMGLLGTMAVGGAAYAAGSSVARGQAAERAQNQQLAELQAQVASQEASSRPAPSTPPPATAAPSMDDKIAQLQQLGELRTSGVLSDQEFEAQKARILGS